MSRIADVSTKAKDRTVREPDFQIDGWCLDDGEAYHARAPDTFWIPDKQARDSLQPGDHAKLIFRISVEDGDENVAVERMWVLVRERTADGYLGTLDNEPDAIAENDEFWLGTELPFSARHVINIEERDAKTVEIASEEPRQRWQR
jgi:uncharacterized protein YegJ (DUF2314 family)